MSDPRRIVTIGTFDGVHAGHAALIARARALVGAGTVTVLSFDPHPASVLRPGRGPARLTTFERRTALLREAGADEAVRLEPTEAMLHLSAEAFVAWLVKEHAPSVVVEGENFRFGHGREGDVSLLAALGRRHGFGVEVVAPVEVVLTDHTVVTASSTMVRWLVGNGRVADAARVLGRAYEVTGEVVRGDRRGREIGCPTANIETACMLARDGVYAGVAHLPDGRAVAAAVSVGDKPTFDGKARVIEAHLLDVARDGERIAGLEEYGWPVRLALTAFVRDQVRFGSIEALMGQMDRDCARVRELSGEWRPVDAGAGA